MIEGTRPRNRKIQSSATETNSSSPSTAPETQSKNNSEGDAVNLARREWFGELIPAFGSGLVKLLRASNNLRDELHETFQKKSEQLLEEEKKKSGDATNSSNP